MYKYIVGIIIFFILLVTASFLNNNCEIELDDIYGAWEAPPSFCLSSGIKSATFWIDEKKMYIYMVDHDSVLINKCVKYKLEGDTIIFDEDVYPLVDNKKTTLKLDKKLSLIYLYTGETLNMQLYKNVLATIKA
jgi:hypothetical protein